MNGNKYVFTVNTFDSQGRVIETSRIVDNDSDPFDDTPISDTVLSQTHYDSIGKVDYSIDEYDNLTKYEYDQTGNAVEVRTYNVNGVSAENLPAYINDSANVLTTSRTLYDAEVKKLRAGQILLK